jgi:hypothetical protein
VLFAGDWAELWPAKGETPAYEFAADFRLGAPGPALAAFPEKGGLDKLRNELRGALNSKAWSIVIDKARASYSGSPLSM